MSLQDMSNETLSSKFASTLRETRQWLEELPRNFHWKKAFCLKIGAQDGAPVRERSVGEHNYNKLVYDIQITIFRWGYKPTYN